MHGRRPDTLPALAANSQLPCVHTAGSVLLVAVSATLNSAVLSTLKMAPYHLWSSSCWGGTSSHGSCAWPGPEPRALSAFAAIHSPPASCLAPLQGLATSFYWFWLQPCASGAPGHPRSEEPHESAGPGDHIRCSPLDRGQPYPVEGLRRALGADPKRESGVSPWRICPLSLWACI